MSIFTFCVNNVQAEGNFVVETKMLRNLQLVPAEVWVEYPELRQQVNSRCIV